MSPFAISRAEWPEAVAAACERMVHLSVADAGERRRQRRFIGVMLGAPFLATGAAVTLVTAGIGAAVTVAAIFAIFGLCWFTALLVAASGRMALAARLMLAAGGLALAGLIAAAGGLASPVAVMALALPFEAWWVAGSRRAALAGAAAALAAILVQPLAGPLPFAPGAAAPWHWLLPLAWGLTLVPRLGGIGKSAESAGRDGARLEGMVDAVVLALSRQGEVLEASDKARSILKVAPELLAGSGLIERVHLTDRIAYLSALADMREGADRRKVELRVRLPRGEDGAADNFHPFSLELVAAGPARESFVGLLHDNGEVTGLRDALAAANEAAAGADIAKGRFLAAVSHELRTPLNAIIGFSDMLLHEMFGTFRDPRQKEYVGLVRDAGQHLLEVVTSILDVSRIESGAYATEPEPFRFVEAVEMCRSMMRLQAEKKGVSLEARIAADAGEINADRRAVQQILINLASNAIKFTPEGGSVTIGAKRIGSRLHFWVSDSGIGIAEEDLASLGKPFMQIQNDYTRRFEGTGLGLALVKGLVALHEGTMSIESAPGQGTTVTIGLPVDGPKQRSTPATGVLAMPPAKRQGDRIKEDGHGALRKSA